MTIIDGLILGIIQGLTEFLPISSSGHLVLVQDVLELELPGNDFEILLHLGTLCSILVVFFKDIKSIFSTISSKKTQKFILMIFIGTIPAVIIGLGLKDSIEQFQKANRDDLIKNEQNEIDIINLYLPKQKSEQEIENIVRDIIKNNNMESIKDMGKLMSIIKNDYAGEVDMGLVGKIAKSEFGN